MVTGSRISGMMGMNSDFPLVKMMSCICTIDVTVQASACSGLGAPLSAKMKIRLISSRGTGNSSSMKRAPNWPSMCSIFSMFASALLPRLFMFVRASSHAAEGLGAKIKMVVCGGTRRSSSGNMSPIMSFHPTNKMVSDFSGISSCKSLDLGVSRISVLGSNDMKASCEAFAFALSSARTTSSSCAPNGVSLGGHHSKLCLPPSER
mmetsp:Transcript_1473/g.3369  ORF Transcript_1473/g.3369 Transcript_1473/m.3369 type:complete len:206 (-) Transcript_1473:1760-2377(-)